MGRNEHYISHVRLYSFRNIESHGMRHLHIQKNQFGSVVFTPQFKFSILGKPLHLCLWQQFFQLKNHSPYSDNFIV